MDNKTGSTEPRTEVKEATSPSQSSMPPTGVSQASHAASGVNGPFPDELKGWNWGAFFLSWIWGIAHNVWLSLLIFVSIIPFVGWIFGIVFTIILGLKGNEWAWQHRKFEGVDQFRAVEKKWAVWGLVVFVISIVFSGMLMAAGIFTLGKYTHSSSVEQDFNKFDPNQSN